MFLFNCLLDVTSSRRPEFLSICIWRRHHSKLWFMRSVFVDDDGHKRWQTPRPVVTAEIETNCNFEAYIPHWGFLLDSIHCCRFKLLPRIPYNFLVWVYSYTILPSYFNRLIHKNFPRSQSSSGSSTRPCSTKTEPTRCTKHSAIQKGSLQCTVGAVSISFLLYASLCGGNCAHLQWNIFIASQCNQRNCICFSFF